MSAKYPVLNKQKKTRRRWEIRSYIPFLLHLPLSSDQHDRKKHFKSRSPCPSTGELGNDSLSVTFGDVSDLFSLFRLSISTSRTPVEWLAPCGWLPLLLVDQLRVTDEMRSRLCRRRGGRGGGFAYLGMLILPAALREEWRLTMPRFNSTAYTRYSGYESQLKSNVLNSTAHR